MAYQALCIGITNPISDLTQLKEKIIQSDLKNWKISRTNSPIHLKFEDGEFFVQADEGANAKKRIGEIQRELVKQGDNESAKLLVGKTSLVVVWSNKADPDMDYFNDFILLVQLTEETYQTFCWNPFSRSVM